MEKEQLQGGMNKIEEYINRINNGEPKEDILEGLPPSFVSAIEKGLQNERPEESNQEVVQSVEVPPQYEGMSSLAVSESWIIPEYVDERKTKIEEERRRVAILSIEKEELEKAEQLRAIKNGLDKILDGEASSIKEEADRLVDERIEIIFDTKVFNSETNKIEIVSGKSNIIDFAGRKIVVINTKGKNLPFYLSTGHGGKEDVTSGKWYPLFGIHQGDGWLNKLSSKEINNYYESSVLKEISHSLDEKIGDIREGNNIPKVGAIGSHIDIINKSFDVVENERPDTKIRLEKNIKDLVDYLDREYH